MPKQFVSPLGVKEFVINDDWREDAPELSPEGFGKGSEDRDWDKDPYCSSPYAVGFEATGLEHYPRETWRERIAEMTAKGLLMSQRQKRSGVKVKSQKRTPLCWMFGTTGAFESNTFVRQGQPYVDLSPASGAYYVTGGRYRGGWNAEAAKHIAERGLCPSKVWNPTSFDRRNDTPEKRQLALRFRALTYVDLRPSFAELMDLLLNGLSVATAHSWWRHLVETVDPVALDGRDRFGTRVKNSWDVTWSDGGYGVLEESKAKPSSGTCFFVSRPFVYED